MNNFCIDLDYLEVKPSGWLTDEIGELSNILNTYYTQLQNTGDLNYADKIELLLFNADKNSTHQAYPTYLKYMWLKNKDNLICAMYGPCKISTIINGVKICIEEITNYPFNKEVTFKISVEKPVYFGITFRIPYWSKSLSSNDNKSITLNKVWNDTEKFTLVFEPNLKAV